MRFFNILKRIFSDILLPFIVIYIASYVLFYCVNVNVENYNTTIILFSIFLTLCFFLKAIFYENTIKKVTIKEVEEKERRIEAEKNLQLIQEKNRYNNLKEEVTRIIKNANAHNQHLANVISGVNHEISPWLGSISNGLTISLRHIKKNHPNDISIINSLIKTQKAVDQSKSLLQTLGGNVKKIQNYNIGNYNLKDTLDSWLQMTIIDRDLKEFIDPSNINIDKNSLNFETRHSPQFLSQIILNLVKNSIDHNQHMLNDLRITITGNSFQKGLYYSDNGRGIPKEIHDEIFTCGFTTKKDMPVVSGMGMTLCLEYAVHQDAVIQLLNKKESGVLFGIYFEQKPDMDITDTSKALFLMHRMRNPLPTEKLS
jgi:signal transduction histidine kinase